RGIGYELPRAARRAPQSDLVQPGPEGRLPHPGRPPHLALRRGAAAERLRQPDADRHRRAAVPRPADAAGAALLRSLPAAEPVLRHREGVRAASPAVFGRRRVVLTRFAIHSRRKPTEKLTDRRTWCPAFAGPRKH